MIDRGVMKMERALQLLRNYELGLEKDIIVIRDSINFDNRMEVDGSSSALAKQQNKISS